MQKIKYFLLTKTVGLFLNLLSYVSPKQAVKLAYRLFSEPRIGRLNQAQLPEVLQNAQRETLTFQNHSFETYHWKGNQNVILLLHGWESNASRWEKILPFLQQTGSTIIAIDAPAHGLSSGKEFNVPLYADFIEVMVQKFQPNSLIGHSIGGVASTYYQHHFPNNLKKMVLLGSPSDFKILLSNYVKLLSLNQKIHQALIDYTKERFHIVIDDFSGSKFLQHSELEGLIAHDVEDSVVLLSEAKKLAATWKKSTFIETKGFGHSLHDAELYQRIAVFLGA